MKTMQAKITDIVQSDNRTWRRKAIRRRQISGAEEACVKAYSGTMVEERWKKRL